MSKQKSTNVRINVLRFAFRVLEPLSLKLAGRLGRTLFLRPPGRRKASERERAVLDRGQRFTVISQGRDLAVWRFGRGPAILLVHGWGGSAAQLSQFVEPLVDAGFAVIAFDGPGHGSSEGRISSLVHLGAAVLDVAEKVGPIYGVLAHSIGAAATSIAVQRGLELERAVFIGPPSDAKVWFDGFSSALGLTARVKEAAQRSIEEEVGVAFRELNAAAIGWPSAIQLLVVHDRNDREVPFSDGERISRIARARLAVTEGLGHRRILADPSVISTALLFLAAEPVTPAATAA